MRRDELRELFHKQLRYGAQSPGYQREETKNIVRHVSQFGERGFILCSDLNTKNASQVIKGEREYFSRLNQEFEWKVYDYDKPDNLKDILEKDGFTIDEPEALMVIQLDEEQPLLRVGTHSKIEEIKDQKRIQDIVKLEETVWRNSHVELGERLIRDKEKNPNSLYLYGIYENAQLISAAWMYIEPNSSFVSLWGGSTLPSYRGKGYYTALLKARAKKAFETGHHFLTVDASPMSRPILQKYGFLCLAYSYGCQPPPLQDSIK